MGSSVNGATSRRKGNSAEVEVCHALERAGWQAITSRAARGGYQSGEDIITNLPVSIEVKNHAKVELSAWWKQAQEQAGEKPPIVVHKRRGHAKAENWWVTLDLETFLQIVGPPDERR
jgi:Holliday junction resolvase